MSGDLTGLCLYIPVPCDCVPIRKWFQLRPRTRSNLQDVGEARAEVDDHNLQKIGTLLLIQRNNFVMKMQQLIFYTPKK